MLGLEYILSLYNMQHIELADKLGIKKQNINLWIKGKQNIPKKYLPKLQEIFSISSDYFTKELTEIDKLEIQKEKLKNELNPIITSEKREFVIAETNDFTYSPVYDKEEMNTIERNIEKAKLIEKFKNSMDIVDENPNMETYKIMVELMEKVPHEILVKKTIEALAHYFQVLPDSVSSGEEQDEFEEEIFEVFDDNNF